MDKGTQFRRVCIAEINELKVLSKATFIQSHGQSASEEDINIYIRFAYSVKKLETELKDPNSIFHFILFQNELAGYSKLSLNTTYPLINEASIAKLDRIYIDEKFLDSKLGQPLFDFNLEIARQNNQQGIWLYTWVENHRAIKFYKKNGFEIIDEKDFKISNRHSNPNYIMYKSL
jgi:ribosomal protein S18 acetylase RimI-like enzyme